MRGKIFKRISLRLVIILAITAAAAMIAVNILNNKTRQLEKEISEIMAADMALPVLPENSGPSSVDESISSLETSSGQNNQIGTGGFSDIQASGEPESIDNTTEETESESINQEDASEESEQPHDNTHEGIIESSSDDEKEDFSEITEQITETLSTTSENITTQISSEVINVTTTVQTSTATVPVTTQTPATVAPTTVSVTTEPSTSVPTTTVSPTTTAPPTTTVPETEPATAPVIDPVPISVVEDKTYVTDAQLMLFKNRIIQNINDLRSSMGLGTLKEDACLSSGSIIRSQEIVTNWSHTRPNGDRGMYVIEGCGGYYADAVNSIRNGTNQIYALGENLAVSYSYSNYSGTDEEIIAIADEVFTNWVNSPTHYSNLIYEGYTKIGLGVTVTLDEGVYHAFWVGSIFCNK